MRLGLPALIGAALLWSGMPALAAPGDDIGAAVRVVNLVTAAYATEQRNLATGDNVRQDDLIEVSTDGIGEIRLRDDTELALGPGSRLLLDEFVYDPDISGGAIVLNLVRGAFRFVTGVAAKPAYVILTPTASITVRGTIFDVYVEASGMSWLLLIEGGMEVCNARNECGLLDEPGKLIRITPEGDIGNPVTWATLKTDALPFGTAFPFVVTPPQIDPDPIFPPAEIVGGDVPGAPPDDDGGGRNDDEGAEPGDNRGDDAGPTPTYPSPPLTCWNGWKQVESGWSAKGWRVQQRRRGDRVVFCAHPVGPPSGDTGIPPKPECAGGSLVVLKTLPPRWRCVCPKGTTRHQTGKNAYVCKGDPGGTPADPKKECLKRGGTWTGKRCVIADPHCPRGYVGTPPNCKKLSVKPCPKGYIGQPPNCKKLTLKDPSKTLKDVKKAIEALKHLKKKD